MNAPQSAIERPPRQDRSRASFERMMNAAEALLVEHGSDGFTLTDVSRVGKVSIGSIYNRFDSKDKLIQSVHARAMARIEGEQMRVIMRARSRSRDADSLIRAIINELAESLLSSAPIMRPLMLRAAFDRVVQDRGHAAHETMVETIVGELMSHSSEISCPDPERAIRAMVRIAYAALARELGFGMTESVQDAVIWSELKEDLGEMAARFLLAKA